MNRELIPGMWGRCGRAIPDPQASELDNVVPMRVDMRQGRDAQNRVPAFSPLAGKPEALTDEEIRRRKDKAYGLRRMLASAIGAWLAFAVLMYLVRLATHGA